MSDVERIELEWTLEDLDLSDDEDDTSSEYSLLGNEDNTSFECSSEDEDETEEEIDDTELEDLRLDEQAARRQAHAQARAQAIERGSMPVNGRIYVHYPPNFPAILRQLIDYIPLQNGRNIRPFVVGTIAESFNAPALIAIANFLSLAPRPIFESIALVIAEIVINCLAGLNQIDFPMTTLYPQWGPVVEWPCFEWLKAVALRQEIGEIELPLHVADIVHIVNNHVELCAPMNADQYIRVTITPCPEIESRQRSVRQVEGFLDGLPIVAKSDLGDRDQCNICLEPFYQPDSTSTLLGVVKENEKPVKLPCGHVFGRLCLLTLFCADSENDRCPMCRAELDILNGGLMRQD